MDKSKLERIKRFINDKATSEAVYEVILGQFLDGPISTDVNVLAASRIAIDLLRDAWKTLTVLKEAGEIETKDRTQIGL